LVWKKKQKKIKNLFSTLGTIRKRKFDCVVNCHRYTSSGIFTAFSGARHTAGYKENPLSFLFNRTARHTIGDGAHETERYNRLVDDITDEKAWKPRLYPSQNDEEKVKQYKTGNYVCLAPASVWFTKQLPAQKWITLCNTLPAEISIYLLGAPDDQALCEQIKASVLNRNVISLAGKLSLLQSCALMKGAVMNYANDSAPLHLASSVNAPQTAFFCSTIPAFGFGPLSDKSTVIQVEELPCKPCGIRGYRKCPLGHFKCAHLMPLPELNL